jgi:prolyl 4-hydroxylase
MWIKVALCLVMLLFWVDYMTIKEERVCRAPVEHEDFLTPDECRAVIKAALAAGMERSEVVGKDGDAVSDVRTSSQVFLDHTIPAVQPILKKAEALLGTSRANFEHVQVVKYGPTQQYEPHYDSDEETPPEQLRRDTLLMYLNTCKAGGHTVFPKINKKVASQRGKAVHWKNVDSQGRVLPCAFHGGSPVISGSKWICTVWRGL